MKKVCIIFFTALALIFLIDSLEISDILIFVTVFLFLFTIVYIIDYFKLQKQKREYDYLILALEKCIERQHTQQIVTYRLK